MIRPETRVLSPCSAGLRGHDFSDCETRRDGRHTAFCSCSGGSTRFVVTVVKTLFSGYWKKLALVFFRYGIWGCMWPPSGKISELEAVPKNTRGHVFELARLLHELLACK